jgi:hypothetical protein
MILYQSRDGWEKKQKQKQRTLGIFVGTDLIQGIRCLASLTEHRLRRGSAGFYATRKYKH